ncbi:MAG: hypothetical protein AAGD09_04190 [Cyanobacteria bacterium P01_F01_bin.56]
MFESPPEQLLEGLLSVKLALEHTLSPTRADLAALFAADHHPALSDPAVVIPALDPGVAFQTLHAALRAPV